MTTDTDATQKTRDGAAPLLAVMRKGDPASCRAFIAHFQGPLFNYLYWLSGDPGQAERLFQQTMMAVYGNLRRVRKARSPEIWVYRQATQLYVEQGRRQVQQRRSSWDNILRSGLDRGRDDKWSQWDETPNDAVPEAPDRTAFLVDALKHLSPKERAAILLASAVGLPPAARAACLQLSRRASARILLKAYGQLALSLKEQPAGAPSGAPKGIRDKIRRQQLGLLSQNRERKLAAVIEEDAATQSLQAEEKAAWRAMRHLPNFIAPASLLDETEAHLRAGQEAQEERIATWGFRFMQVTVPVFILAIIAIILLPTVSRSLQAARVAAAKANLEEIGKALQAYSAQSNGYVLPPMAADAPGEWVPDLRLLYPRYIKDPSVLVRPSLNDPEMVKAMQDALAQSPPDYATAHTLLSRSYVYTGYVLLDESALSAFKAVLEAPDRPNLESDIETADRVLRRLKKDVEYLFVMDRADPQAAARTRASIPIMFETVESKVFGREPDSANVLYLDGHVESVRFGSQFPLTEGVMELLDER